MKPVLFSIGNFDINGYGLMIAIGALVAETLAERKAKKVGLEPNHILNLVMWSVVFGFIGGKGLYWITIIDRIIENPSLMLDFGNGFVVYGSIIAIALTCGIYCKLKKLDVWKYIDLLIPYAALAQGFGRIGCFLAGCCYGMEYTGVGAVVFTESLLAPNNVSLFPTQLLSSALNFVHCLVLLFIYSRKKNPGIVFSFYLMFYSMGRFLLEYYRGDLIRGSVGSFSTSQFISIFIFVIGVVLYLYHNNRKAD